MLTWYPAEFTKCLEKADLPSCTWYLEQLKAVSRIFLIYDVGILTIALVPSCCCSLLDACTDGISRTWTHPYSCCLVLLGYQLTGNQYLYIHSLRCDSWPTRFGRTRASNAGQLSAMYLRKSDASP